MKSYITVAIRDDNQFFVQGMKALLLRHFSPLGCAVRFVASSYGEAVDLLIVAESTGGALQPCRLVDAAWRDGQTVIVTVRGVRRRGRALVSPCHNRWAVIGRRDAPPAVVRLIELALAQRRDMMLTGAQAACTRCALALTPREREVLYCTSWGETPSGVAKMLNISAKTVSAHKVAAMRKLGFQRNSELYHWLRQGGLEKEKRTLS